MRDSSLHLCCCSVLCYHRLEFWKKNYLLVSSVTIAQSRTTSQSFDLIHSFKFKILGIKTEKHRTKKCCLLTCKDIKKSIIIWYSIIKVKDCNHVLVVRNLCSLFPWKLVMCLFYLLCTWHFKKNLCTLRNRACHITFAKQIIECIFIVMNLQRKYRAMIQWNDLTE